MTEKAGDRRRIEAVTFDVGGTLIGPWPSVGDVYAQVAAENDLGNVDPAVLNRQFQVAWAGRRNFNHSREGWLRIVQQTFAGIADSARIENCFDHFYRRFESAQVWRLYEDVLPVLEWLRHHGIKLAIISNWDERLRPLLDQLGLAGFFGVKVISCEVGEPKPSPLMFQKALNLLAVSAGATLHVGDSCNEDYAGAKRAGLAACLLTRGSQLPSEDRINSLLELQRYVVGKEDYPSARSSPSRLYKAGESKVKHC
jgi:putative hydrolase of the HAD superfamily